MEPTMSSCSGQSMNHLSPPYANSNCGSLRSYDSICSSISSRGGEVHINAAYNHSESGAVNSSSNHDYEDLQSIRTEWKAALPAHGPRSKTNDLYEPTGPLKHRVRQITECSDDSTASSTSSESLPWKKESCLSKLILFLILAFSVAALVLVILIINGTVGPKCGCTKDFNPENKLSAPSTGQQSSLQNLLRRIEELETNMLAMQTKMEARHNAVEMFVTKHENQVEVLQVQVNKTANKVAVVDGVWVNMTNTHDAFEKKLDTEFKLLNESVKELNMNDNELTSSVNELRQNQILTKRMSERLAINVTQLESRVQELRKASSNISSRAASLENGYTQMNNLMGALQVINGAQNASHQDLQSMHKRLIDSLTAVNATLNDKLQTLGVNSGKPAANFSTCKHRMIRGTPTTADNGSGTSSAVYSEPQGKRAMGITCSTNSARHYKLMELRNGFFKCSCRSLSPVFGTGSPPLSMWCDLHVWECPI